MTIMTADEFDGWVATALEGFASAPTEDMAMLVCTDVSQTFLGQPIGESLVMGGFPQDKQHEVGETVNRLLLDGPPRKVAGMATHALWSPMPDEPTTDAWLACVVARRHTAVFAVKRWVEDALWHRLEPKDAPWLILSCASGLRGALESAEPLVFKNAQDRRLFNRVDEEPPPVDEQGRL